MVHEKEPVRVLNGVILYIYLLVNFILLGGFIRDVFSKQFRNDTEGLLDDCLSCLGVLLASLDVRHCLDWLQEVEASLTV